MNNNAAGSKTVNLGVKKFLQKDKTFLIESDVKKYPYLIGSLKRDV